MISRRAFAPVLAAPLYWAIALVLVFWFVRFLVWFVPGCVAWMSDNFRRAATATAVAAVAATPAASATPPHPRCASTRFSSRG